ncbi:DgyrCDS10769 [Dimorphilus gyrociliatus]|uniref:DgyrCDS10769 n=1 Tax=Dimorphilus gyrociliatus TaxID=2664684 RepID=A0A7I8W369_9ANNE|nr:DgyrCDS10769 [Dimorphilus gyrociliatus]
MGGIVSYLFSFWNQEDTLDESTGLRLSQKRHIVSSWSIIEKDLKGNGVELFITLFTMYPETQNMFKRLKNKSVEELRKSAALRAHGLDFNRMLSAFVENLDDVECLVNLIQKVVLSHLPRKIGPDEYLVVAKVFHAFMKMKIGSLYTPAVQESWDIVFGVIHKISVDELKKYNKDQ